MREAHSKISIFIKNLSTSLALLGAIVLCFIAIMVLISIIGRAGIPLGLSSIKGDFELVEVGTAFAVLAFMPYAQLHKAHAEVIFLSEKLGKKANKIIDFIADFIMLLLASLLAWRLTLGTIEKFNNSESSFILQFPIWWAYGFSLIALYIWVLVALWIVFSNFNKVGQSA